MTSDRASAGHRVSAPAEAPRGELGGDLEPTVGRNLAEDLQPGTIVEGKYQVESVLGRGGMGIVVAATHVTLRERVALKFLLVRDESADDFAARFRREAQVSAKLRSEHVARVIDVGTWHGRAMFMVMEFLAGTDLRKVIRAQGPLPIDTAIAYMVQVCEGMAEAHAQGVVHRDLKPSNLFLTKRPDGSDLIKILDFGISKWNPVEGEVDELTRTGVVLGSPKYVAPEQVFGSQVVDSRADIWSLGAILYELLCGRPPFDFPTFARVCAELASGKAPPSLVERRPDVTPELEAVVLRCLERDVSQRIQNVADLAGDLLAAVGSPHAAAMRARLYTILETKGSGVPSFGTGTYPVSSGAHSSLFTHSSLRRGYASPISDEPSQVEAPQKRRSLVVGAAMAVALGVGTFFLANRVTPAPAPAAAAAAAAAAPGPASLPATGKDLSASSLTAAPSGTPAPGAHVGAAAATASAPAPETKAAPVKEPAPPREAPRAVYRPAPRPAPAPVRATAPAPAPTPAPAPAQEKPEPAPKRPAVNPLEDRQ